MNPDIRFGALDGSNPLAFLAALGALRLLTRGCAASPPRIRWVQDGYWHPEVSNAPCRADEIPGVLLGSAPVRGVDLTAELGKNLTVTRDVLKQFSEKAQRDRTLAGFAAAFGCEAIEGKREQVQRTDFCFITGSGHQDFLGTAAKLDELVTEAHLKTTLFGPWVRDEVKGASFRWDPDDAAEYALQFKDPSKVGSSSVVGANWLAFQALPCFSTQPCSATQLRTTGFRRERG
ncbi:MAG: type I-G CRISPR-associated protein, Cas3-extension family, partial [Acetobacteraceae bacterium]